MPVSTIDPTVALVVIDLQEGHRGVMTTHPFADVVGRCAALAAAFREHDLPVVLVTAAGRAPGRTERASRAPVRLPDGYADLLPELGASAADHLVVKHRWGAFTGTDLDHVLRVRGVTQVVITGVSTSVGVESTARAAYELGYDVVLATDAMTDLDAAAHENSVGRIFPKLGETGTTAAILAALR